MDEIESYPELNDAIRVEKGLPPKWAVSNKTGRPENQRRPIVGREKDTQEEGNDRR